MQRNIASRSVAASTARGMGPRGTVHAARNYFQTMNLRRFNMLSNKDFEKLLDSTTVKLMSAMPEGAKHWGSSRKFLNIFLRHCLYNRYLCTHYRLHKLEAWLEVPLDSHVARGLRLEKGGKNLPRWQGVIHLTPSQNQKYQNFALSVAKWKGTKRVHLDILYWRGQHMANKGVQSDGPPARR
jgi:hypothetical protein